MMSASFWLMLALVLGLTITAIGMIDGVDKSFFPKLSAVRCPECHELFSEWAPHFGPELLVLVFAALLIDRNRIRRERTKQILQSALGGLLFVIRQCEQREMCFF